MKYLTLTLLLLTALPALAQQAGSPPETDWYTVELVVFEQASDRSAPPPADPVVPDTTNAVDLQDRLDRPAVEDVRSAPLLPLPDALRFLPAPAGARILDEAFSRLDAAARYRPILRMAWRQRVAAFSDPVPVRVEGGEELARAEPERIEPGLPAESLTAGGSKPEGPKAIREVDGTVALVRGRYLHFNVDLVFREPVPSLIERAAAPAYGTVGPYSAFPTWHIGERRQVQPGDLQYFDHRRFGVIAIAEPWLAPEPSKDQLGLPADNFTDER